MEKTDLRTEFTKETKARFNVEWVAYNDYVEWLEQRLVKLLTIPPVICRLSDRVDEIANKTDADINRTLFRIVGNYIEVYEIDLSEEKVKSFLGSFKINEL